MDINATLLGQMITFAVLVAFTMKFVWPPLTKAMAERQNKIASGLAAAEKGQKELREAQQKINEQLQQARREAARIIEQANQRSAQLVEDARQQARREGERLLAQAQMQLQQEIASAKKALQHQVAHLVVLGAEKILQQELTSTKQQALVDQIIQDMGAHE